MRTRGASACVLKMPTGFPDWTSRVSSLPSDSRQPTIASKHSQFRAALPMPPYTTSSPGRSATSGSRLFMSIRSAASWSQDLQRSAVPRGALTTRCAGLVVVVVIANLSVERTARGGRGFGHGALRHALGQPLDLGRHHAVAVVRRDPVAHERADG